MVRSSHSTQLAAARAILDAREQMVAEWVDWLESHANTGGFPRPVLERQLRLVVDGLVEMLGPLRREAKSVWSELLEYYGRTAAARGLAAGEVVEEIQELRLLLIKYIGAVVAAMRPRRAVAVFVRLNDIIDRGIAQAVVGYTDALVASLMLTDRQTQPLTEASPEDVMRQLDHLESELTSVTTRR